MKSDNSARYVMRLVDDVVAADDVSRSLKKRLGQRFLCLIKLARIRQSVQTTQVPRRDAQATSHDLLLRRSARMVTTEAHLRYAKSIGSSVGRTAWTVGDVPGSAPPGLRCTGSSRSCTEPGARDTRHRNWPARRGRATQLSPPVRTIADHEGA